MIPIKLTFEGLYSYQLRQTIDFEKLTSNHLFGIFGSVGSGKSTILEAITFSLYGKTDRLNLSGDNRNYNMMNLKSNQLFIEFDFKDGEKTENYKVVVQAKRNSKKYEDVRTFNRAAYKLVNQEYIPITNEELEGVVGLSYDNFKRTIIIPQGKFQEFLQLGNTDRTRMMKELFNLNKYELSYQIKSLEAKNNAHTQNLEGQLEQLGNISVEQLNELKLKQLNNEKVINSLTVEIGRLDLELIKFAKLKELTEKIKDCQEKKNRLSLQQKEIQNLEKELAAYEYCIIHFKSILDTVTLLTTKVDSTNSKLKSDQNEFRKSKDEHENINKLFKGLQKEFEQINEYRKESEAISKIIDINKSKDLIKNNLIRREKGALAVTNVTNEVINLEKSEKEISQNILALKKQLPDTEELSIAKQWFLKHNQLVSAKKELEREIFLIQEQIKLLESKFSKTLNKTDFKFKNTDQSNWIFELKQIRKNILLKEESATGEVENLLIKSGLEASVNTLKKGEPCPLCGSETHPSPINSCDIAEQLNLAKTKLNKYQFEIRKVDELTQSFDKFTAGITPLKNQLNTTEDKLKTINLQLTDSESNKTNKYKSESKIDETYRFIKDLNSQITKAEENLQFSRESLTKLLKNKERYQQELNNIDRDIESQNQTIKILESQISSALLTKHLTQNTLQLSEQKKMLDKKILDVESKFRTTQKKAEELKNRLSELDGKINANKKHLEEERKELQNLQTDLETKLKNSVFNDLTEVKSILNQNLNLDDAKTKIKKFTERFQQIINELKVLKLELGDAQYDEKLHLDIQDKAALIKDKINKSTRLQGELQSNISDQQKKIIQKENITSQLEKLKLRAEDIKTLKKLFHSSGFVNYISSVYLQNLCSTANHRFYKMTRQKLSLELSKDNNFEVRDYMNGGKLRSIKTLSGGQTFQAALSLALALADNIQSLTQSDQNFFFLDEGFGSLDKESLDIVFSTLKNLRKENRIVGVISHVEEMQQEISTYLHINQNENSGSIIEESWNK